MKYTLCYKYQRLRSHKYDDYSYFALTDRGAIKKGNKLLKHAETKFGGKWELISIRREKTGSIVYRAKKKS